MTFVKQDPIARFYAKLRKTDSCWLWTGNKGWDGYGHFWLDGRDVMAHRFSYELHRGQIPDGLTIDHLCRNKSCVNPEHLDPCTAAENTRRSPIGGWVKNRAKDRCMRGHPFTPENTRIYRGWRHCRECGRQHARRYYREKRARSA